MEQKTTQREEKKIRDQKVKKIIETPVNYTLEAQESRLKLQQPTP